MRNATIASVAGASLALGLLTVVPESRAQSASSAKEGDVRYLAANCANCHGTDGRSAGGGGMPGLAGLSPTYFVEQMRLFRGGQRQATIMHQLVKGYTEEQVAALADYFSKQPTTK